jgi:hypothetical protein
MARSNAEQLFGGIAQRFTNVQRDPKFQAARGKLGKNALTPSQIYNDTSVWSAMGSDNTRTATVEGEYRNGRYTFTEKPITAQADAPGDARHTMILRKINNDEYDWYTNVDIAVGAISAADMKNVISALMKSAEHRSVAAIRADYRETFPRTTAALGRLFTLDSLVASNDADGANSFILRYQLTPD